MRPPRLPRSHRSRRRRRGRGTPCFRGSTAASIRASNSARRRRAPHLLCRGSARRPYRAEAFAVAAAASSSLPGLDAGTARDQTVRTSAALLHTSPGNRGRAGRLYRAEAVAVAAVAARRRRGQRRTRRRRVRVVDLHRRSMGAACAARPGGVPLGVMIHGRRRAHAGRRYLGSASARRAPRRGAGVERLPGPPASDRARGGRAGRTRRGAPRAARAARRGTRA